MRRDPIGEIVAHNKPLLDQDVPSEGTGDDLTREALRRKLEALAASAFQFLRGTFHLMARDIFEERVPRAKPVSPEGLIVGDLHLENFGVYQGQSRRLCFEVNDFDDVGRGPTDLDLRRLCTSALLLPGISAAVRTTAASDLALAWADEVAKIGGRFPVPAWRLGNATGLVDKLLREAEEKNREELIQKVAPGRGHRSLKDPKRFVRPARRWVGLVQQAFGEYQANLEQLRAPGPPQEWKVLDVAYEFKGVGSLGRMRFAVLVGKGEKRRLFELKEARPSAMDAVRGQPPPQDRGRAQTASIRRLQGDPWPLVASTHLGKVAALGRENEPWEKKVTADYFAKGDAQRDRLYAYARQCGRVLARLQCRQNAPVFFDTDFDAAQTARDALAFARKYAAQVRADHQAFLRKRAQVAKALGVD